MQNSTNPTLKTVPFKTAEVLKDRCETCKFYMPVQPALGFCRRYPPTVFIVDIQSGSSRSNYPPIQPGMWCGEFITKILM